MKKMVCLLFTALCLANAEAKITHIEKVEMILPAPTDSTKLLAYVGKYNFKPNEVVQSVELTIEKGALLCTSNDNSTYKFEEVEDKQDTFNILALGAEVVFVRDANKKVIGLKVNMQSGDLLADKEEAKK
jgi:hypothetical protein